LGERSEHANPLPFEVQAKGVIQRVPGFVPEDAHALDFGAAFNLAHVLALQFHQPRMREIKRNSKPGHAVRGKPFRGQPHVRFKANTAIVQLAVKTFDVRFEEGSFNPDREVTDARVQKSLIRDETPFESRRHGS
jgi:hypothetical protein